MKVLEANSLDIAECGKPPATGDVIFTSLDQPPSQGQREISIDASPQVDDPAAEDNIDTKKRKKKKREKKDP